MKILPALAQVMFNQGKANMLPTQEEQAEMASLLLLLKPFEAGTKMLSSEKKPTISLILPLWQVLLSSTQENPEDSQLIAEGKQAIRKDLEKRYQDVRVRDLLSVATVLDPRFKSLPWMDEVEVNGIKQKLREELEALPEVPVCPLPVQVKKEPQTLDESPTPTPNLPNLPNLPTLAGTDDVDDNPDYVDDNHDDSSEPPAKKQKTSDVSTPEYSPAQETKSFFDVIFVKHQPPQNTSRIELELRNYFSEADATEGVNPITWWNSRSSMYPILRQAALKYLCIPATSVASERVFSVAGAIVTRRRARLSPDNVNMLVFLNKNSKE